MELQRHPARGLPAQARRSSTSNTCRHGRALRCRRCAARVAVDARVAQRHRARAAGPRGRHVRRTAAPLPGAARSPGPVRSPSRPRVRIRNPRLWEPGHPNLYTRDASLRSTSGGRTVQRYTVHTGIRSLKVNRLGRIELNGREVDLRGAAIHEDSLSRGAALTPGQMRAERSPTCATSARRSRARTTRSPRTSSSSRTATGSWSGPRSPCTGWRARCSTISEVRTKALRMLRDEITRDYNHPSVMVWSIGNENASRPETGLQRYIRKAARTVQELDPTRLVGLAIVRLSRPSRSSPSTWISTCSASTTTSAGTTARAARSPIAAS